MREFNLNRFASDYEQISYNIQPNWKVYDPIQTIFLESNGNINWSERARSWLSQ